MTAAEIKSKIKDIDEGLAEFSAEEKKQFGKELLQKKAELESELKKLETAEKKEKSYEQVLDKAKKTIASKTASTTTKNTAKKKVVETKKQIAKVKEEKAKVIAKTPAKVSSAKALLEKLKASKEQKDFNKGRSKDDIELDSKTKALPAGKRISAEGNTYYEYRANRSDVSTSKKPYLEMGGQLSTTEKERLDYLQSKEDTDSLTKAENEEYEMLVEKYRLTSEYPHSKKADQMASLVGNVFRPFNSHNEEYWVTVLYADFENIEYADDRGEIHKAKTKDFLDSYIKVSGYYKKGGKLSNKGAYLNDPQSKNYTRYEDSKESNRAKPAGWRYTDAGAKRLKLKTPNQLVAKEHLEKYRGKYFTDSKGNKHRYLYIERRADKSDVERGFPFLERGGKINSSIEEQKKWSERQAKMYDHYVNHSNDLIDLKENLKKAINRNDADEIKRLKLKKKNLEHSCKFIQENFYKYAKGGSIPNNYKGKTPEQVWNEWSVKQKEHFLADHADVIEREDIGKYKSEFKDLSFLAQAQLSLHIEQGQYEKGGSIKKAKLLIIDSSNPLSTQLSKETGDSWNGIDYEEKNYGNFTVITHKESGKKFVVYVRRIYDNLNKEALKDDKDFLKNEGIVFEKGGEVGNMDIANECALKVYVKPNKKEGLALFQQADAICVLYEDDTYDWVGESDILKMEQGEIVGEIAESELQSQNINVFGYETQNFDVSEHAATSFLEAIKKVEDNERGKDALTKAAKHLDRILHKVKVREERLSEEAEKIDVATLVDDIQRFAVFNYQSGLQIDTNLVSNICADILELDVDSEMVYEKGGEIFSTKQEVYTKLRKLAVEVSEYDKEKGEKIQEVANSFYDNMPNYEQGGEIIESNNEMLQSQLKAVEHHAKELSSIITDATPIEAWVVGKIERASTDLSDITHYLDGLKYEKGGKLSNYKYIPNRDIEALEINKRGKTIEVDGADTLDGIYVRKGKYEYGGEMYAKGGKVKKGDIGKITGKQYGFTLKEYDEKSSRFFVSPKEYWQSEEGTKYKDYFGRTRIVGDIDKDNIMSRYAYHIMIGIDLGSKNIPTSAKKYAELMYVLTPNGIETNFDKIELAKKQQENFEDGGEMKWGGRTTFNEKVAAISKSLEGRKVKLKYQKEYGKTYDKKEARTAAQKITGKLMAAENRKKKAAKSKMEKGGDVDLIKNENEKVLKFIKDWQSKNEYKKENLKEYNAKFNKDFNSFLGKNNFSKETLDLFKIEK